MRGRLEFGFAVFLCYLFTFNIYDDGSLGFWVDIDALLEENGTWLK